MQVVNDMRQRSILLLLSLVSLPFSLRAEPNLLENGSFEISKNLDPRASATIAKTTQIDSWTIGGANGIFYVGTVMTPSDGVRSVMLQFVTANSIQQTIGTIPGQSYRVYFDASAYVGPDGSGARVMRGLATARAADDTVIASKEYSYDGTGKSFPNVGWAAFSFDFTASGPQTTLRWESKESGNNGGPSLDHTRVVPGHDDGNGEWVISGPPVFSTRMTPTTQAVAGRPFKLEVEAVGDGPLTYQWYKVSNNNYNPLAGADGPSYEIESFVNQTGVYAVIASNAIGSITNLTSVVRVSPPTIVSQPEEQHVMAGQSLNFGPRSFSGSVPDRYQWFKDGVAVEGQTNQYFMKTQAELSDAGIYTVWVANIAGESVSSEVPVLIFAGPVPAWIKMDLPAQRVVQEGGSLFLSVSAEGAFPLYYSWSKDGEVVQSGTQASYSKNGAAIADSGEYSVVVSNSVGMVSSATTEVIVYPMQEAAQFASSYIMTNVAEGVEVTLSPVLVRGSHLVYQWYKRPLSEFQGLGEPIPGATSLELSLGAVTYAQAANYILLATNFVGQNQATFVLNVVARPIFSMPLQGFEGTAGQNVQLNASIENYSAGLTYQWFRNGEPISGATQSFLSFTANANTAGTYTVVARNEAGESTSNPATVVLRETTPSTKEFRLVADYTIDAPERPGVKLNVVGDGNLRNHVVTFQSTTNYDDVGGLYRWQDGVITKIVDLNDSVPTISAPVSWYDGLSAEDGGISHFLARSTNAVGNQSAMFEAKDGKISAIFNQDSDIPGKSGVRVKTLGYATRAKGKTAFLAMESDTGQGGYRCVLVWDGTTLANWANSDDPFPAGDGIWWGNSSQVGFDGTTLAFWAVDKTGTISGFRNGIVYSVNGAPLKKIAFTGDPIPGGLGTFKGFNSPPRVHEGKILFLAQAEGSSGNMLCEYAEGTLRIIAKSGDAPQGAGALASMSYNFDYLADGSILFSAYGPGQKQGIYNWKEGVLTEALTTLNTIAGRQLRFVSLYDVDGTDCLISASFDGSRFGLYTTASGQPPAGPKIAVSRTPTSMTLDWAGGGVLQQSIDLRNWSNLSAPPPYQVQFNAGQLKYYRVIAP